MSEFDRLVAQLVPHDATAGPSLPLELVRNAGLGALLTLAGAALAAFLVPGADSIRSGDFFLVAGGIAADWATALQGMAAPLALLALALGALDVYLWQSQPTDDMWRWVCIAQPWCGLVAVSGWLGFAVLAILNLAVWAAIIGLIAGVMIAVLFGLVASAG